MHYVIQPKSILNKTKRRDPWFLDDYTINPYSGCSFSCNFCYIQGSKYGINLEEKVSVKSNAAELLEKQLAIRAKKNQHGIIVLSSSTDPYLHFEKELALTRSLLEIILKYKFPVHIITRSPLVTRDLDILSKIAEQAILPSGLEILTGKGAIITFSFCDTDDKITHLFEPGAPSASERINALKLCLENRFIAGVSMMPLLPYITDTGKKLEEYYQLFTSINTKHLFAAGLTLYGNSQSDNRTKVFRIVKNHFPELEEKYHTLFKTDSLPQYYTSAFRRKIKELSTKYGLPEKIL